MKTAILTGTTGFIGNAVLRELLQQNYKIYAVIRDNKEDLLCQDGQIEYIVCALEDIKDLKNKIPNGKYDIFYHFAWAGSAGIQRANTKLQLQNVQWTIDCLNVAKQLGCQRFICAGSIMEHETVAAAFASGNRPGMGYIYGGAKVAAHIMCMSVAAQLGIELIWTEITNAYGPGEISPRMINTTISKCIQGISPQFTAGTQNYDFVYIDDVAKAFRLIGERGKAFCEYTIGSSNAKPLKEFLLEMQEAIAPNLEFIFGDIPFTGIDLPLSSFDCSETEKDTGFRAKISFVEGCRRTMQWLKENKKNESKMGI